MIFLYYCPSCQHVSDSEVCEGCGDDSTYAFQYRSTGIENHFRVFTLDESYVGEIYRTKVKYDGEAFQRLNPKLRKQGILQIEEHVPTHRSRFTLWTFRKNPEEPFRRYEAATEALFKAKGW